MCAQCGDVSKKVRTTLESIAINFALDMCAPQMINPNVFWPLLHHTASLAPNLTYSSGSNPPLNVPSGIIVGSVSNMATASNHKNSNWT